MAEKREFFFYSIRVFNLLLLWPKDDKKSLRTWFLKFLVLIFIGFTLVLLLSETLDHYKRGRTELTFTYGLYTVAIAACSHKLVNIASAHEDISNCINELQRIVGKFKSTQYVERSLRLYRRMFIVGTCITCVCSTIFWLSPFTRGEYRALPFTPHFSFLDPQQTPYWHLLYMYQISSIYITPGSAVAYDTLFCGMICLCSAAMGCICQEIRDLDAYISDHQQVDAKMKTIVDRVNEIIQITQRLSNVYSMTTMTHMIYNCNTLAVALFTVTLLPFSDFNCITMMGVIFLVIFQLWIYCYFGQSIVDQREILQMELYFTRWYDASKTFKKMLILMIFEPQRDQYIYAGKIMPLALETLIEVIKKAYAFVTFMNNFT